MKSTLYLIVIVMMFPLSVFSQASGGQIIRKNPPTTIKKGNKTKSKSVSKLLIPTILVIDEALKTCELHSFNGDPCIPISYSGEYVVPERVNGYIVTQVGANAFQFCTRINNMRLPSTVTSIKNSAFFRCDWLKSIEIPKGLTEIGNSSFMNCYALSKIEIPNSVKTIGSSAFHFCKKLKFFRIPESLIKLESFVFCDSGLTSIIIPSSIKDIEMWAFGHCKDLNSVECISTIPPKLDKDVFTGISENAVLYIPHGSRTAYENAGWCKYFSKTIEQLE